MGPFDTEQVCGGRLYPDNYSFFCVTYHEFFFRAS